VERLDLQMPLAVVRARAAECAPPAARRALDAGVVEVAAARCRRGPVPRSMYPWAACSRSSWWTGWSAHHRAPAIGSRSGREASRIEPARAESRSAPSSRTASATTGPCSARSPRARPVPGPSASAGLLCSAAAARFVRLAIWFTIGPDAADLSA
jgi:hypothetical protein